jgi:hypothetical protein
MRSKQWLGLLIQLVWIIGIGWITWGCAISPEDRLSNYLYRLSDSLSTSMNETELTNTLQQFWDNEKELITQAVQAFHEKMKQMNWEEHVAYKDRLMELKQVHQAVNEVLRMKLHPCYDHLPCKQILTDMWETLTLFQTNP